MVLGQRRHTAPSARLLADDDLTNNEGFVPVTIPEATSAAPVVSRIRRPSHDAVVTAGGPLSISWTASGATRRPSAA